MINPVKVLFFATLRDKAGVKSIELELPTNVTVADFKNILVERLPTLKGLGERSLVAINHEYTFDTSLIPTDAEIAIFPPVSGG